MLEEFSTSEDYVLENGRAILRPLVPGDLNHLLPFALNEPGLWKFSLADPAGRDGMKAYIEDTVSQRTHGLEYPFIVYDKLTGTYAGSTRFYDINLAYKTVQLGYTWYGTAFQRSGLNRNCKYLLLDFAFGQIGMERVEFRADAGNAPSIAAMKAIGCKAEGILRSNMPTRFDKRRDSIVLSILKDEWHGEVKSRLAAMIDEDPRKSD